MLEFDEVNVMGYNIVSDGMKQIDISLIESPIVINTLNPHSYVTATNNYLFETALRASNVLLPDGAGVVFAGKFLSNKKLKKFTGPDLHLALLDALNKCSGSCFYMGSSEDVLFKIKKNIHNQYPNISVECYSPPFKKSFDINDDLKIRTIVNSFKPDVLFVGMTAPKQEIWLHANRDHLDFKVAACIGAAFDWYAGTIKRTPRIFRAMHLEWLFRLINEPVKLWRRNLISTPLFIYYIIMERLRTFFL